jgi:hypothetical protein
VDAVVVDGVVVLGVHMQLRGTELELQVRCRPLDDMPEGEAVARIKALGARVRQALQLAVAPSRPCPD